MKTIDELIDGIMTLVKAASEAEIELAVVICIDNKCFTSLSYVDFDKARLRAINAIFVAKKLT